MKPKTDEHNGWCPKALMGFQPHHWVDSSSIVMVEVPALSVRNTMVGQKEVQ